MKSKEGSPARWVQLLERYKYVLLVALVGALLLLWPGGKGGEDTVVQPLEPSAQTAFDLGEMERKLSAALSRVAGAGTVDVILTVGSTSRQVVAMDDTTTIQEAYREQTAETVVVGKGSGAQEPILLEQIYPEFQGALVVCTGGDDPSVQLKLVEAISALTGLGADKISICKGK